MNQFERILKTCSKVRIGALFTLPSLGTVMRAAVIAHIFPRKFSNKRSNVVLFLDVNHRSKNIIINTY